MPDPHCQISRQNQYGFIAMALMAKSMDVAQLVGVHVCVFDRILCVAPLGSVGSKSCRSEVSPHHCACGYLVFSC